jgi:hypothetical protein
MKGVIPLFAFKGVKTENELNIVWGGSIYYMRTHAIDRTRFLRTEYPSIPLYYNTTRASSKVVLKHNKNILVYYICTLCYMTTNKGHNVVIYNNKAMC